MSTPLKLAQLAALPAVLVGVSLVASPRAPRGATALEVPGEAPAMRPADRFFAGGAIPGIPLELSSSVSAVASAALGDWSQITSGASPVVDLACSAPDDAAALALARGLEAYLDAPASFFLLPPWHPAGVTADQTRARATLVAMQRAILRALQDPAIFDALRDLGGERDPAVIQRRVLEVQRTKALEALERVAKRPDADPAVADELRRIVTEGGGRALFTWQLDPAVRRRVGERLGSLVLEVTASDSRGAPARLQPAPGQVSYGARGRVQVEGRRLSLGGLVFQKIARGLPALLAHLAAAGCTDARIALTDRSQPERGVPEDPFELEDD